MTFRLILDFTKLTRFSMLTLSSDLMEIHAFFANLDLNKVNCDSSIEDIKQQLEDDGLSKQTRINLFQQMYSIRLKVFLETRNEMCKAYKVLSSVEKSALNLFSMYKMEIELVLEQFSTAFYMQLNAEMGDNAQPLTEVRMVSSMLANDLRELRVQIKRACFQNNTSAEFLKAKCQKKLSLI